jgi:N-acetylmuramoyl-L-alanine amidase-like protein
MATPMTASQMTAALIAEGVNWREVREWRAHNRNHKGPWGPVHGVMIHHTVSSGEASSVALCYDGYAELPGPLCQAVIAKSGTVHLTGNGRCNHAGGGSPDVLQAVIDERYTTRPPATRHHDGSAGAVDGNRHFYGAECINLGDGKDPWPADQVDAIVRWAAAICRYHGWSAKSVVGHKEWSDWKNDPRGPGLADDSMVFLRAKIAERLAHPASWNPTSAPAPTTGTPMADPNLSVLSRTEDLALPQDTEVTIYWTGENTDEGNEHAAGGKTVLDGGKYTAVLNLRITGLGENETVLLYPAEEDASGNFAGAGTPHEIEGRGNPALPVQVNIAIAGRVYNRLSFRLKSTSSASGVTLADAQLVMLSWPTA